MRSTVTLCSRFSCAADVSSDPWFNGPVTMSNSEAFVETFRGHGVNTMFGIVGSAFMDALDIFEPAGIRFVSVQHEQGAAHMADGYSRVTDKHGVCIAQVHTVWRARRLPRSCTCCHHAREVDRNLLMHHNPPQNGPGISNFVTGVAAAYWAHSPVIVVTPEAGTLTKGWGGFQELDQLPVFETITKFQVLS